MDEAWRTLIYVVLVFACVLAHEFGHVLTARSFGVVTPDVTLFPFGGLARLNTIPDVPYQEFLITAAGPAVNVVIAGALIVLAGADVTSDPLTVVTGSNVDLATRLATTNLFLAAFNLIPAFPMDGGRLLRAVLAWRLGFTRATELAARIGQWLAFVLAFIGIMGNPMLIIIAVFIYFAAGAEAQDASVRAFSSRIPVTRAMMTEYATLAPQSQLDDAVATLLRTSQRIIPVVDFGGRLAGVLELGDVVRALHQPATGGPVSDVMTRDIPTLDQGAVLSDAFRMLQEKSAPAVGIVDGSSRLVGLVTLETLGEMLMLHGASPAVFDRLQPRPWASSSSPQ
jgi:stage IV sporulation protein FB